MSKIELLSNKKITAHLNCVLNIFSIVNSLQQKNTATASSESTGNIESTSENKQVRETMERSINGLSFEHDKIYSYEEDNSTATVIFEDGEVLALSQYNI